MTPEQVIARLEKRDVKLKVVNGALRIMARRQPPKDVVDFILANKRPLLDHLKTRPSDRASLAAQWPEDRGDWRACKRVFGDAFPPASDPLQPLLEQQAEPRQGMTPAQAKTWLLRRFAEACPPNAKRNKQGAVLRQVLTDFGFSDRKKVNALMLADWPSGSKPTVEEAIELFITRGWCGLCHVDPRAAEIKQHGLDHARISDMIRSGAPSRQPMPIPRDAKRYAADREAFLKAEETRQRLEKAKKADPEERLIAIPILYESASDNYERVFMGTAGYVLRVKRSLVCAVDPQRVLIWFKNGGIEAVELAAARKETELPRVTRNGNAVTVRCDESYRPKTSLWARSLVLDHEKCGITFALNEQELTIARKDGASLSDRALGQMLPRPELIREVLTERERTAEKEASPCPA